MAQITFELDEGLEQQFYQLLAQEQLSVSNWVKKMIRQHSNTGWSNDVVALAGSWDDFPSLEEIRSPVGEVIPREVL